MENEPYKPVMGAGAGNSTNAPFIKTLLPYSATSPYYDSLGIVAPIRNCSAGCYAAVTSGNDTGTTNLISGTLKRTNIFDRLTAQGLTWKGFCEDNCTQRAIHFPPLQYSDTYKSQDVINTCPKCSDSAANYTLLMTELNSDNPSNFIWFTPTDCHNMHGGDFSSECVNNNISCTSSGSCIRAGDNYLKQLLVGTGNITNPAAGSVFSTRFFRNATFKPALMLWWDECADSNQGYLCDSHNDAPNLLYGTNLNPNINHIISTNTGYDEYSDLRMIEENWALPCLIDDCKAASMNDFFH